MDIKKYLHYKKSRIDKALEGYLPKGEGFPGTLHRAMRYSVFAGGKRLRPILTIASAEAVGGREKDVISAACAIELIHTYSLIHDDLPSMDDDSLRRGKPTCHKAFGEAMAILAGDALLTLAFELLSDLTANNVKPETVLVVIGELTGASGSMGMVGGQAVDIESQGEDVEFPVLEYIHIHKTGKLILASIRTGALLSMADDVQLKALTTYGEAIGLAFQVTDDILDIEGDEEEMGKKVGGDIGMKKITYPSLLGMDESKKRLAELMDIAMSSLSVFGKEAEALRSIAKYIVSRVS